MFRKWIGFMMMFVMLIGSMACTEALLTDDNGIDDGDVVELADETTPERKIIYEVDISFDVTDLDAASAFLKTQLLADEWFDQEIIASGSHSYIIRIKTERLDAFIAALQDEFVLRSYQKVGTDISLDYQDATNRILSLEAQLARLLELYDQATLDEMIHINEQISDIEVELQELQGTLNQFDSLVEYSEVTLKFYGSTIVSKSPFFNRLGNAFVNGFQGLLTFFDGLSIVLATIFPFLVVFGAPGIVVWIVIRKKSRKQKQAPTEVGKK